MLGNGIIEVAGSLDFETDTSYSLTLKATDSGSLNDTTGVVISVTDVNESPSFIGAPYSATIAENDAAASVVTVAATDPDGKLLLKKTFTIEVTLALCGGVRASWLVRMSPGPCFAFFDKNPFPPELGRIMLGRPGKLSALNQIIFR